jgi:multimeric flavodoxin WrbA
MYEFTRRAFLGFLGKITAALGVLFSLGAGCAKEESEVETVETVPAEAQRRGPGFPRGGEMPELKKLPGPIDVGRKKIMALCCGSENGNCETFIRAAAIGAGEYGIDTEIIRAATLDVNVLEGNQNDDVNWIYEKTLLEDCALICAVPCYHVRANGLFYSINDRMLGLMGQNMWMCKKTRVGAVIGVGGSGYDAWASLTNLSTEIFMQHTRKVVDQVNFAFCGMREWNMWMQQGKPLTSNTHKQRVTDVDHDVARTMYGEQPSFKEWYPMAIERAKQLGRNVAEAMNKPIEEAEYQGEEAGVACPLCHCNTLLVPENLPHVYCPICAIRGTIVVNNDHMKVEWNMEDLKLPRFSYEGELHHGYWLEKDGERRRKDQDVFDTLKQNTFSESNSYAKVISPYV